MSFLAGPNFITIDPRKLKFSPWNPNRLDSTAELKLDASLDRLGLFKPIICRKLGDGSIEIMGGQHRAESAARLGWDTVDVVVFENVPDERAKEILLLDNGRYGRDDALALSDLLSGMVTPTELASFMPFDAADIEALNSITSINLDTLGLDENDNLPDEEKPQRQPKTHEMMRLKLSLGDAETARKIMKIIMEEQGFDESDDLTNAGDAFVYLINQYAGKTHV